jgi:hypothetical protein
VEVDDTRVGLDDERTDENERIDEGRVDDEDRTADEEALPLQVPKRL